MSNRFLSITRPLGHPKAGHQQADLETETSQALQWFKEALGEGMLIVQTDGEEKRVVSEFDPNAELITITPPLAGG